MLKKTIFYLLTLNVIHLCSAAEHKITMLPAQHLRKRLHTSKSPCVWHLTEVTDIAEKLGSKKYTLTEIQRIIEESAHDYTNKMQNPLLKSKTKLLKRELEFILLPKIAWAPKE